jgi:hypothetical protein
MHFNNRQQRKLAFVKKFEHFIDAEYPDNGCCIECYTCNFMQGSKHSARFYVLAPRLEKIHVEDGSRSTA